MRASRGILVAGLACSLFVGQPAAGGKLASRDKRAPGGELRSGGKPGTNGEPGAGSQTESVKTGSQTPVRDYPVKPVPFTAVHFNDAFWAPRIEINRTVTIPFAFQKDEETKRVYHFERAAKALRGEPLEDKKPPGYPF